MPSELEVAVGVQVVLAVWIGLRSLRVYQGRRYSEARVLLFPVLVLLLFLETEVATIYAVAWAFPVFTVFDVVILAASAAATWPFITRLVKVTRRDDGALYYQYGIELISIYLGLWVVRLALAAYYDPSSLILGATVSTSLSATASDVLVLIQALFAISSGIVIGRAIGTYRLAHRAMADRPLSSAP